jgi:branched-chain amino acid transport system permease protein
MARLSAGQYYTSYHDDEIYVMLQTRFRIGALIGLLIFFLVLPKFLSSYFMYIMCLWGIALIGATGMSILLGMTGLISLAHGILLMIGGVTAANLATKLSAPLWLTIPSAGFVTAIVGALIGLSAVRLKGFYLALVTFAAQIILYWVLWNWDEVCGSSGIILGVPTLFGISLGYYERYYYLIFIIAVILFWAAANLKLTKTGRAFQAIRDRDIAAELMGISLPKYKLLAFSLSSFYAGIAGALLVHMLTLVPPEYYTLDLSIDYLAMILIGGMGSLFGAIIGSFFVIIIPMVLEFAVSGLPALFPFLELGSLVSGSRELFFGLLMVIFLIFEPLGLTKIWTDLFTYFKLWPFSYER